MKTLRVALLLSAFVSVAGVARAASITDGFWDYNNADGYTLFTQTYTDLGNKSSTDVGIVGIKTDGTNLYLLFAQQLTVNDNTYGTNAVGWGMMGHKFSDLTGSDHMDLSLSTPNTYSAAIDYIGTSSPFVSGGAGGDDGKFTGGTAGSSALTGWATSLQWDLAAGNNTCGTPTTNSPDTDGGAAGSTANSNYTSNQTDQTTTNTSCGTWVFPIIYELQFSLSALGLPANVAPATVEGMLDWVDTHNSPAKGGGSSNICNDGIVGPSGSNASVSLGCSTVTNGSAPEPFSVLLLGSGLVAIGMRTLVKRRKA